MRAQWVDVADYPAELNLPGPPDWPIAAMALALRCPLVSGNARHFPERLGLTLYSPREWLETTGRAVEDQPQR